MIRRLEGRPRGWYAGPVGWIGLDEADFAVGIRAGIVRGRTLRAFAGAGIVSGSDPKAEWDETARKAASFLNLFTEAPP
jgi:menaquinone-specific isochorismate synthase